MLYTLDKLRIIPQYKNADRRRLKWPGILLLIPRPSAFLIRKQRVKVIQLAIDYKRASELALPDIVSWLPPGEVVGKNEYATRNPTRADDQHTGNFVVNLTTGAWIDNAKPGECGGDACSLYAYLNGMRQSDAAKDLLGKYDTDYFEAPEKATKATDQFWVGWRQCIYGHRNAPELDVSWHAKKWGEPMETWPLYGRDVVSMWIVRFPKGDGGGKVDKPFTLWTKGGEYKWRASALAETKYPLYNRLELESRPNDLVLLAEGQKVPSRLHPVIGDKIVCVGWYGGAGNIELSDLSLLRGREVVFSPDADNAGRKVLGILRELDVKVRVLYPPTGVAKGWDLADALADGWTRDMLLDAISSAAGNEVAEIKPTAKQYPDKYQGADYTNHVILHEIFAAEKYKRTGLFCFDGIPYTWNGKFWEKRTVALIGEEFYHWAFCNPGTFAAEIEKYNWENEKKQLDAQVVYEKAARNISKFRGGREFGNENPFSSLKNVKPYWNFPNGLLEIKDTGVTWFPRSDNDETFFMDKYPMGIMGFEYDASAIGTPMFESTVARVTPDRNAGGESMKLILQCFAYSLLPVKKVPYYFVCYGKQGSGKSSLAQVLKELAGEYFIAKAMKEIFQEFGKSSLVGKLIAYDDDIQDDYILPAEIKKLAGGNEVTINEKRVAHYQAVLNIAPWIIGNKPPRTTGIDGHGRRAVVMHLSSDAVKDPFHMDKMFGRAEGYRDERPAIMNMVLDVIHDFIAGGYIFDKPDWAHDDHDKWLKTSNSVSMYFTEMKDSEAKEDIHIWYSRTIVYGHYLQWCERSGERAKGRSAFYEALEGEGIQTRRVGSGHQILCHFEVPKLDGEDRHILKLATGGGTEYGENHYQDAVPF